MNKNIKKEKNTKILEIKIKEDADFIVFPRFGNSLERFVALYPDGVDDKTIAKVLLLEVEEVEALFESAVKKIRKNLKINNGDLE